MPEGRGQLVAEALAALERHAVIEVTGWRGSGRSDFLRQISRHFREQGWQTLEIIGAPSFASVPFASLGLAGIASPTDINPHTVGTVLGTTTDSLPANRSIVLVDDYESVDEPTLGVLREVRRKNGVPIVYTGLEGRTGPLAAKRSLLDPDISMLLEPMGADELEITLSKYLKGDISGHTNARLFSASGGNIGLALAIAERAKAEGRLQLKKEQWVLSGSLWNDGLRARVRTLLDTLDAQQLRLLERISLFSSVDAADLDGEDTWETLETLERAGMVEAVRAESGTRIAVRPQLVADYFRTGVPSVRARRLFDDRNAFSSALPVTRGIGQDEGSDPLLIRLIAEDLDRRLAAARADWEQGPCPITGIAYLRALIAANAPDDAVREHIANCDPEDEPERARWTLVIAEWRAYAQHEPGEAVDMLRTVAAELDEWGPALAALACEIECDLEGKADPDALPAPDASPVDEVRALVHRAHAHLATVGLRIDEAEQHLRAAHELRDGEPDTRAQVLIGYVILAQRGPKELRTFSAQGVREAKRTLDPEAIRAYAALQGFADFLLVRNTGGPAPLDFAACVGGAIWSPPFAHLAVLVLRSVNASRQSMGHIAGLRRSDLSRFVCADGPLPAQSRLLADVQTAAGSDGLQSAADRAVEGGIREWNAGQRFNAVFAFLGAVELDPTPERLASVREYLDVLKGGFLETLLDYGVSMAEPVAEGVEAGAERMVAGRQYGSALALFRRALRTARAEDNSEAAERIESRIEQLSEPFDDLSPEMRRLAAGRIRLSGREREVAILAAQGRSNAQIAAELVLSQRTVESHMHRIMIRLDISSRTQIKEWLPHLG